MDLAYKNGLPSFKPFAGRAISGSYPIQSRPIPFSPAPFVFDHFNRVYSPAQSGFDGFYMALIRREPTTDLPVAATADDSDE